VITVIGTPLDEHLNPRFDVYRDLIDEDQSYLRKGQLLILRSTVYPGTTERFAKALEREGHEVDVAFCPERVAEGFALKEIASLPQIVSGVNERARQRAEKLFKLLTKEIIVLPPLAAELTKLYNNAWRYIQFAVSNQFYMIANDYGIDFYAIHEAMTREYPRAKGFPRAGFAAGPCLFKDTMQLSAFNNNALFLGHAAMLEGCIVEDGALISMGAIVLQRARVGAGALVAAGSVVRESQEIPPGVVAAGVPAVVKKHVDGSSRRWLESAAREYRNLRRRYLEELTVREETRW